jgi:hypothetical protein
VVEGEQIKNKPINSLTDYQKNALEYSQSVKQSPTDSGARKTRIRIMKSVIQGNN